MREKIVITTTSFGKYDKSPLTLLEERGFQIKLNPYGRKLNRDDLTELLKGAVGIIAGTEQIDASILKLLPKLKVISRCGTGIDNIDIDTAKKLGIVVYNTPDVSTLAVAELTIGLTLSLLRKIHKMNNELRYRKWEKQMGNLLFGKKIGIIGFGRIGRKVAELLKHFGGKIKYYDTRIAVEGHDVERVELSELLKDSDIISIHASTKEQIIGENEIRQMKKWAWLVNVSRGGVVDENALYLALKSGHLSGAAIDVFEQEPYTGPLSELDNVILTPHIGSYAVESRIEMELQAASHLLKGLQGK